MNLTDEDKEWIADAIGGALAASETRLTVAIERVETRLLTAFHDWASPIEQKLRSHREALRALDLEIEAIGGRVAKLETERERPH